MFYLIIRKKFYCEILEMRREKILEVALERANNLIQEKNSWAKKLEHDKGLGMER